MQHGQFSVKGRQGQSYTNIYCWWLEDLDLTIPVIEPLPPAMGGHCTVAALFRGAGEKRCSRGAYASTTAHRSTARCQPAMPQNPSRWSQKGWRYGTLVTAAPLSILGNGILTPNLVGKKPWIHQPSKTRSLRYSGAPTFRHTEIRPPKLDTFWTWRWETIIQPPVPAPSM